MSAKSINTEMFSQSLRRRGVSTAESKVLVTVFEGSDQEKDLTLPTNCGGIGRIHHFRRNQGEGWPKNPLPIDPAANFLGTTFQEEARVQVFQNAICSWRCWYCFVDFDLLVGDPDKSIFLTAGEILDRYSSEEVQVPVIDLSGGQPDLVPEWTLWMLDEIAQRGLSSSIYVWSDDNLSNDFLWRFLSPKEIHRLVSYRNYGRVGCFKGFDESSFAFNTKASPDLFREQFRLMRRLVLAGIDVYGYATLTHYRDQDLRGKIRSFVDMMQEEVHPLFPLRTIPLHIREYRPVAARLGPEQRKALEVQHDAVEAWLEELETRFSPTQLGQRIFEHKLT